MDVGKIFEYYGKTVILTIPHIHARTGSITTSYLHDVGKIKAFKKCVNSKEKMNVLEDIGLPSTINEKTVGKKFQNLFKQNATSEWKMNQLQKK